MKNLDTNILMVLGGHGREMSAAEIWRLLSRSSIGRIYDAGKRLQEGGLVEVVNRYEAASRYARLFLRLTDKGAIEAVQQREKTIVAGKSG